MEPFPFPYILFSVFFRCVSMRSVFVGWPQFPVRCVCSTTYTRVRCACVIYDYRSHYDVKSTTMCVNFRMCETITNKNTRMLISLSLNVYYPSRCLLFIFVLVFCSPYPQRVWRLSRHTTRVRVCVHFMRIEFLFRQAEASRAGFHQI